ncbi:WD40 repeat-like protein [Sodiomyces alkalinus F11]|uniref:WD40 repeat-like protein n=1 Tax=Sodiomyces alkalinus (strain CBS 110278 / VKM F-3762 / F11) TaxID=1314773 RepID=A0A3N2PY38_SODAK|nr:WD40 repeat-like protein [Sodiomyces alkalinus F11]ROT39326.1 WD40 repeat-like protein [Sodiomyces alkalinus F11]
MKSTPLIINWHDQNAPIYSAHFEPQGKGRLATAGGDNNVRLWKIDGHGEDRKVEYLSTLSKHTQAVNVVRWAPKGELLASAGDDGNVILWVPAEHQIGPSFASEGLEDKETWRAKHMCRSSGSEIYDLAWSPDSTYFIIGSMDNVARVYNASTGMLVRQIAEHSHYVQGVAWDPLDEFIATQSSDRSVHVYSLRTKDGRYSLSGGHDDKPSRIASHNRSELPALRIASGSPAPPDSTHARSHLVAVPEQAVGVGVGSPAPSAPGTPTSMALPMHPPSTISHSRKSSFSSARRSPSPAPSPSMPLPAVMPMEPASKPHSSSTPGYVGARTAHLYANETLTSFFRRLTFTPDGSVLLTPAGQYQSQHQHPAESKTTYEVTNTVYIYSRGGINRAPIAHLPGHKKPSVVVKCSPVFYQLRTSRRPATQHIAIDTSSTGEVIPSLPEPVSEPPRDSPAMEPPPPPTPTSTAEAATAATIRQSTETATSSTCGPPAAFALPYRMVYAVGTQDSVLLYDTQQHTPICIVSNLHCATFTDLAWSKDGLTLLITSSDGFCSTLSFSPGELGQVYQGEVPTAKNPVVPGTASSSHQNTPVPTPTSVLAPPSPFPSGPSSHSHQHRTASSGSFGASTSPLPAGFVHARPLSPSRSTTSASSSSAVPPSLAVQAGVATNPLLIVGSVPSIAATHSGQVTGMPVTTPPETPGNRPTDDPANRGTKRDASTEREGGRPKRRRIAPTLVEAFPDQQ